MSSLIYSEPRSCTARVIEPVTARVLMLVCITPFSNNKPPFYIVNLYNLFAFFFLFIGRSGGWPTVSAGGVVIVSCVFVLLRRFCGRIFVEMQRWGRGSVAAMGVKGQSGLVRPYLRPSFSPLQPLVNRAVIA